MTEKKHSKHFEEVRHFYRFSYWKLAACRLAVKRGWITKEEFQEITYKDYDVVH